MGVAMVASLTNILEECHSGLCARKSEEQKRALLQKNFKRTFPPLVPFTFSGVQFRPGQRLSFDDW